MIWGASIALGGLFHGSASAQDWNLVINGKSIHVDADKDWNEANWGLGIEREFDVQSHWVKVALVNGFKDSQNAMSYMAGGGIKRRFRMTSISRDAYVDLGVVAFMMTRQDVRNNEPFPGLLPAMTIGSRNFAVNLTYLPGRFADEATNIRRVDPQVSGILFVQFKISPGMFGFGEPSRGPLLLASSDEAR